MEKYKMYITMIACSLMKRGARMMIALLAVLIGSSILSGLLILSKGIPKEMGREFRSYGSNLLIFPLDSDQFIPNSSLEDMRQILDKEEVVGLSPLRYATMKVNEQPVQTAGIQFPQMKRTRPYWFIEGRWPEKEGEILLGREVADLLRLTTGARFSLRAYDPQGTPVSCEVKAVGILETGRSEEAFLFMDLNLMDSVLQSTDQINLVEASIVADRAGLETIVYELNQDLPGLRAGTVKRIADSETSVLDKLQSLILLVTVIILILTMICVATTMVTAVLERRKEIGLKKALGASNKNIVSEFLGEGIVLGTIGGILGVLLGGLLAQRISLSSFGRSLAFPLSVVPLTILSSVLITAVGTLIPVRQAISVNPAVVLKGE